MARGDPLTSPWVWEAIDYQGNKIRISVAFDNTTFAIVNGSTVFRDANCRFTKIYIGVGPDGTVESSPNVYAVPAGTTTLNRAAFTNNGLNTINDVLALQITAGV